MDEIGQLNAQSAIRSIEFDDVRVTYVVDGAIEIRPEAFFPALPAEFWRDTPDALTDGGFVAMSAGGLLVERAGHRLLIDAGYGPVQATTPIATIKCGALPETLAQLGVKPDDIDVFAMTHLHIDHTGWAFVDGEPTFPSAAYRVAQTEIDDDVRSVGTPEPEVLRAFRKTATTFTDGDEIAPGVSAIVTPGHTAGHTTYRITTSAGRKILAFGDAFHIPAQISHYDWQSAADARDVLQARARLLGELEQPDTIGFGTHFGDQVFGRVLREKSLVWQPIPAPIRGQLDQRYS
ncbi:MBL fold metallo-hydrolase [Kibdelosporangium philippinense]|uniref:MBL fold metallo-hydrolase n=1 Tax=Kibdelosporangium philippinense TaxID=211113 RepID=A0ABS8ZRG3_9PSEU|nr:MBL fold metallo-hydrolase [Kibdelosporangium philippinense]MCE7010321.1 MBL fold metallo-hydrolase [Kibdelosporangium philippinense]